MKCDIYDLVIWHRGGIRLQPMEADGGRWKSYGGEEVLLLALPGGEEALLTAPPGG